MKHDSAAVMKTMLAALVVLSFAAGCDNEVVPAGGGGAGPEGGNGGNGANGNGGDGNGGDGVGGGADECDAYMQQESPPVQTVPITVRNGTESPIYLGVPKADCSGDPLYRAATPAGEPVKTDRALCELTCSELTQSGCDCVAECAAPSVIMIYPGGMAELSWTAIVYEAEAMPTACYAEPGCAEPTCISPATPPGSLVFSVDGFSDVADCSDAICDCDGGESGACIVEGATLVAGAPVAASAAWSQNDATIGITFE